MENKINIAKLLKECPQGMELDCSVYDNVTLEKVCDDSYYPIVIKTNCGNFTKLTKYGQILDIENGKCVIFPKGKTTWEGFQRPFKDGDIVFGDNGKWVYTCIYKEQKDVSSFYFHAITDSFGGFVIDFYTDIKNCRLATEKEKEKLFQVIKNNGYKWNSETKTLEKLVKPKFKVGDVIQDKNNHVVTITKINNEDGLYEYESTGFIGYDSVIDKGISGILFIEEDDWEIIKDKTDITTSEKMVNRKKFAIGDVITNGKIIGKICSRDVDSYRLEDGTYVFYYEVHNWRLVNNKFDVTTLKPFDKVLVRNVRTCEWVCGFFSHIEDNETYRFFATTTNWKYCIPYNDDTKHLAGKIDEAPEFYRYWED